ncbi:sulfatase-like hydrolase/transferase [Romeria aff. gracilis LEGE 07310]|uniref:Sulfatase-like hydrolase/transferase n=1 Tax=Vasconcelosia minhoensis LEGE 07310 TaxID=915328 RepID=A0A8J7A6L6_9CYAN|nr:sulfatase-like hydrolase/transferase [Romeria gracilis]MBE9076915.1 sulfatase-like hydrolase/transferase [Romeria aff. gracilis LEGE 07310]
MSSSSPDVVFLVLDTQRADRLSCYGYPLETSPHIDALAADATLFKNAIAPAQWTIPSHASMFTGVYPSQHQMLQSYSSLPEHLPTLAERLQAGGYFTAAFCNNPLVGVINNGLRRGFYSFLNYSGLLTSRPNQAGVPSSWLDRYRQQFKRVVAGALSRIQDAFARSEALLALSFTPLMVPLWQTALNFKGNTRKSLDDAARLLIRRQGVAEGQPVFTFINLMGVHMPYHPPRSQVERFAPHVLKDRQARSYLRRFNSDVYGWLAPLAGMLDEPQKATLDGMYDAEVAHQDSLVGAFFDQLARAGRLDNTLVIVCADHGEHLGEKRMIGHSLSIYNELIQVPLIIRGPQSGFAKGTYRDDVVSTRRLFHTVLTAAGLATPEEAALSLDAPPAELTDESVFAEAVPPQNVLKLIQKRQPELVRSHACDQARRAVWSGQHKLIETGSQTLELYDFLTDPQEDLDLSEILPEQVEALQESLEGFRADADQHSQVFTQAQATGFDHPEVRRRLQDLGYLED